MLTESVPYEVYLIILKDRQGNPRGVEKSTQVFYFTREEAEESLLQSKTLDVVHGKMPWTVVKAYLSIVQDSL